MAEPPTTVAPPNARPSAPSRLRQRLATHVGLLLVTLASIGGMSVYLGTRVMGALPDVGKNLDPPDTWGAPIAVERRSDGWLVAHIPPCAQGPVTGLFLWDDHDRPFWELRGEAFPFDQFLIGGQPDGLKVVRKLREPPRSQIVRLGVFRANGRPAGVTFRIGTLQVGKVRYRQKWMTPAAFNLVAKCPKSKAMRSSSTSSPATVQPQLPSTAPTTYPSSSVP